LNWLRNISYFSLLLLIAPVLLLLYEGFGPLRNPLGYGVAVFRSIELTLLSSALAALVEVLLFTPLAYYLARNRNSVAESLTDIPAVIPHPIVGVALLLLASPLTPFGSFLLSIGLNLFNSLLGLVVALVIVSAPIYVKSMQPFFESMNLAHENFALGLGASRMRTFISVVMPSSFRGVVGATLIAMSRAMSEFGSIAILAYYVLQSPFYGVNPAPVLIFDYYSYYGLNVAVTASAVMILVSIALMILLRVVRNPSSAKLLRTNQIRRLEPKR
jgi:molybdate/tungstate transport system permease protein